MAHDFARNLNKIQSERAAAAGITQDSAVRERQRMIYNGELPTAKCGVDAKSGHQTPPLCLRQVKREMGRGLRPSSRDREVRPDLLFPVPLPRHYRSLSLASAVAGPIS